jgi:putative ABC transport system permease protein
VKLWNRVRYLLNRERFDRELQEEMRIHRELAEEKLRQLDGHEGTEAAGNKDEARYAAQRQFGNTTMLEESSREVWTFVWLDNLWQDIRFGIRMLRKNPGFTTIAITTLALGIGANASIFSVLESQLWKPLPFPDSERLVFVGKTEPKHPKRTSLLSVADYRALVAQDPFESVCAFGPGDFHTIPTADSIERINADPISSTYFDTLRAQPVIGRPFTPDEQRPGHDHEAILSYAFWQSHYGGNSKALGQVIALDGVAYTIVGVAPDGLRFEFFGTAKIYVPLVLDSKEFSANSALLVVARQKPDVPLSVAQADMDVLAKQLVRQYPTDDGDLGIKVENLRESFTSYAQGGLFFFAGAAALVLLIACANVASLLLARGIARRREFAVRAALGAGRGALVRQLLVEGGLLGILGGTLGLVVAAWTSKVFDAFLPEDLLARKIPSQLDGRVIAFALAISFVTVILSALLPGLLVSRIDVNESLRGSSRGDSAGSSHRQAKGVMVIAEVAMAVALLFGAGLFLNSFFREAQAPLGFDPHNLLSVNVELPRDHYGQQDQLLVAYDQILRRARAVPGITAVALASQIPFAGGIGSNFTIVGHPKPVNRETPYSLLRSVTPNYFQLLKIRFLAGRPLNDEDTEHAPRVVVINENLARKYFTGENPVGSELDIVPEVFGNGISKDPFRARIVGVVENTHMFGPNEVPLSDIYFPVAQAPVSSLFLVAATTLPPSSVLAPIRQQITQMDRNILMSDAATMEERASDALRDSRGNLVLIGIFAGLAVALVAVGIFGAIAYFVEQRTCEFGIRLALGATPARILGHALGQAAVLAASGLFLGIAVSLALGKLLRSTLYLVPGEHGGLLYGVSIYDPLILGVSCGFLVLVLLLSSSIPARRATRVDPMVALRHE